MRYWLQTRAPAGNWVDSLGSASKQSCIDHGRYLGGMDKEKPPVVYDVRVVERVDTEVWNPRYFPEVNVVTSDPNGGKI